MRFQKYTWNSRNPIKQARLDFSQELLNIIDKVSISPGYRTDHSLIELHIKLSENNRGRGVCRFNNSLLREKEYIDLVKKMIKETKIEYSTVPLNEIDDLSNDEIPFKIPDDLFLETLLLKIRGATIPYCAANKRNREILKKELLEKIEQKNNICSGYT